MAGIRNPILGSIRRGAVARADKPSPSRLARANSAEAPVTRADDQRSVDPKLLKAPDSRDSRLLALMNQRPTRPASPEAGAWATVTYRTEGGTAIIARRILDYNPATTVDRVEPQDRELYQFLTTVDPGEAQNVEKMDPTKVWAFLELYVNESPELRATLDIQNLRRLSPKQALQLAEQVAIDRMNYNYSSIKPASPDNEWVATPIALNLQKRIDGLGVHDFLLQTTDSICRNYTEVVQGVFSVLKENQDPATTQLNNSYIKQVRGQAHMWNALYTVQPGGSVIVTSVDATFNDDGKPRSNAGLDATFGLNGAYDFYRVGSLLTATGNRPLRRFRRLIGLEDEVSGRFTGSAFAKWLRAPSGSSIDSPLITNERLQSLEIDVVGLAEYFVDLPLPSQVTVFWWLANDIQRELAKHLDRKGESIAFLSPFIADMDVFAWLFDTGGSGAEAYDEHITMGEVGGADGINRLSEAFDLLSDKAHGLAYAKLALDVRKELDDWRERRGLDPIDRKIVSNTPLLDDFVATFNVEKSWHDAILGDRITLDEVNTAGGMEILFEAFERMPKHAQQYAYAMFPHDVRKQLDIVRSNHSVPPIPVVWESIVGKAPFNNPW